MDVISIQDILSTKTSAAGPTYFSAKSPEAKRQLVVTAILELIRAEAMGGTSNCSVIHNINNLDGMVEQVMNALEPQNNL